MTSSTFATVVSACIGVGCCIGGVSNAYDKILYDRAIENPSFLYLVDEDGNPVTQKAK